MKNILVTGGAGFIGSEYIDYTLKKYGSAVKVLCVDKLTYAGKAMPEKRFSSYYGFRFAKADICDKEAIARLFEEFKPDVVVNFAAESHVDRAIADSLPFFKTNVDGTVVLLDACRRYGVERFHQVSTDEVYGSAEGVPFTESSLLSPSNPYSASKAAAELAVLSYAKTYGLNVTITRSSNNYGRYQFPEKLVPVAVCSLLSGKKVPLYGKGECVRDWLYVTDNCAAIDAVVFGGEPCGIYNVAGNFRISNAEVVERIARLLGVTQNYVEFVPDRPGRDLGYYIDDSKLKRLCPLDRTPFDDGLKRTVEWYCSHREWWSPIFKSGT